jgi:gamma-glutamylcyclotransferase (GGCT)/AIG2-like uncharacterized protein YtfP
MDQAECLAENCTIEGQLYDTGWGYPALLVEEGNVHVKGELYRVTSEKLKELDQLEGHIENGINNLYERVMVKVKTENGEKEAIVYVMTSKQDHFNLIEDNDWVLKGN